MSNLITSNLRMCSIEGCSKKHDSHGLCGMHSMRKKRYGSPLIQPQTREDKFWSRVDKTDGCWIWQGVTTRGYGKFGAGSTLAHRHAYVLTKGKIPEGLTIDHLCFNKRCVNPDHLEAVTHKENMHRMQIHYNLGIAKTHCPQGHEYSVRNTYRNKTNRRVCRECARLKAEEVRNNTIRRVNE